SGTTSTREASRAGRSSCYRTSRCKSERLVNEELRAILDRMDGWLAPEAMEKRKPHNVCGFKGPKEGLCESLPVECQDASDCNEDRSREGVFRRDEAGGDREGI